MGILVEKKQQGGRIFADTSKMDLGARDYTKLVSLYGTADRSARGSMGRTSPATSSAATAKKRLDGALQSDLNYYNTVKRNTESAIAEGLERDPDGFDDTPEYSELTRKLYQLEAEYAPQLKNMAKLFGTSKTSFMKKDAGDSPAVLNDHAIVFDKSANGYTIINQVELIKNANNYDLASVSDVVNKRENDARFSGFTKLGQFATQIMDNAYGQKSFDKFIKDRVNSLGYTKMRGNYEAPSGDILNLQGMEFNKEGELIKTNSAQIDNLINDIRANTGSSANNYIKKVAIRELHSKAKASPDAQLTEQDIYNNIMTGQTSQLARQLRSSLIVDLGKGKDGKEGTGLTTDLKNIKRNVVSVALYTLGKKKETVEADASIKEGSKAGTLLYKMHASEVYNGDELIEHGYAIAEADQADEDKGVTRYNRKVLENNSFINNIKGSAIVTTVDGTPIVDITDNNDTQLVTTPKNARLHFMIAPIETREDGYDVVNFENKYATQIKEVTDKTYEELAKQGISQEMVATGKDKKIAQKAADIANTILMQYLGTTDPTSPKNLRLGVVAVFDVIFESDGDSKNYKYAKKANKTDIETLNDRGEGYIADSYIRRTKAFVPVSNSFWDNILAHDALPSRFSSTYDWASWRNLLETTPEVSGSIDPQSIVESVSKSFYEKTHSEKKEDGGKLISADEAVKLLFE